MNQIDCDITNYAWLDHESVGFPDSHSQSLELFREKVVRPSLQALDAEITRLNASDEPSAIFITDDYADLFQTTVEGYLIAVQSMWERGLRAMLIQREKKLTNGPNTPALERATWEGKPQSLQDHFLRLMGVSLHAFDVFPDLDILQNLANAIRHGDGASARKVHELCPKLWFNWIAPGDVLEAGPYSIVGSHDGPKHPPFESITLPERLLEQMIQSVMWFWEDIEHMRCNSFKRKSPTVVDKISMWRAFRAHRCSARVWNDVDGAFPRDAT